LREQADAEVQALRQAAAQGKAALPDPAAAPAFAGFKAVRRQASASAASTSGASTAQATAGTMPAAGEGVGKGSSIQGGFDVPFAADRVWRFMSDLPAVAGCLPGAVIEEQVGDE